MAETTYTRKCQECGHRQKANPPPPIPTDAWRNAKCRNCKSEALDFGSYGWIQDGNTFTRPTVDEE